MLYQTEVQVQRLSFKVITQNVKLYTPTRKIQCHGYVIPGGTVSILVVQKWVREGCEML